MNQQQSTKTLNSNNRRRRAEEQRRKRKLTNLFVVLTFLCVILVISTIATMHVETKPKQKEADADWKQALETTTAEQAQTETTTEETNAVVEKMTSPNAAKNKKHTVMLDAGHGDQDGGCTYGKLYEKDVTLKTALQARTYLQQMGYKVIMIRDKDIYYNVFKRAQIANAKNPDIYVSIHVDSEGADESGNAKGDGECTGVSSWYTERKTEKDKKLAEAIVDNVADTADVKNRGAKVENAYVVNVNTQMTSTLVEIGFMTNKSDRDKMGSDDGIKKYAEGIAKGIEQYYNN